MINRVYIKNLISFNEIEVELEKGLIVLSGPSGAGKSLFINTILSTFGYGMAEASLAEVSVSKPLKLKSEVYLLEDEVTLKVLKKEKARYYLDGQHISKKRLNGLFSPFVQFLSVRDKSGFESKKLIELIDNSLGEKDKTFKKMLKEYKKRYANYKVKLDELEKIRRDELKLVELIEFAKFEIEKIESIAPKIDEDLELIKIKQQLSRIDKINDTLKSANNIFKFEESVDELYRLLDKENDFFTDSMNQLRVDFEEIELLSEELSGVDIEAVLDRLEKISTLKNRYGGIKEALAYADVKREELQSYNHMAKDKSMLEAFLSMEYSELMILSNRISMGRKKEALSLEKALEKYLDELKLPPIKFIFTTHPLDALGQNSVSINLNGSFAQTLSGGEFNRVRLALMVVALEGVKDGGVVILDEIDANVSGDESIAIANMIAKLSSVYQIFAISHQPHLASKANQHLLISKLNNKSKVIILDKKGKVDEIARIIGGERANSEALSFAKRLIL
jgi:DNA repair protein RecN (Recombination protein N)